MNNHLAIRFSESKLRGYSHVKFKVLNFAPPVLTKEEKFARNLMTITEQNRPSFALASRIILILAMAALATLLADHFLN